MPKDFSLKVYRKGKWLRADLRIAGRLYRYQLDMKRMKRSLNFKMKQMRVEGVDLEEIGFSLGKLWKKAKRIAKKTVRSKVWRIAEKATKLGSLLPPPYGPALAGASAAMKTTRALIGAKKMARRGNRKGALRLIRQAKRVSRRFPGVMRRAKKSASGPLYLALVR